MKFPLVEGIESRKSFFYGISIVMILLYHLECVTPNNVPGIFHYFYT